MIEVDRWQNLFSCHCDNKRRALDSNIFVIVIYYDEGSGSVSHSLSFFSKLLSAIDVCMYAFFCLLSLSSTMDIRGCRSDSIKRKKKKTVCKMYENENFFFDSLTQRTMAVENEE